MNRKALTTIQIVLAIIVLVYCVSPDPVLGPFDDGLLAFLAAIAEVVIFVYRTVHKPTYTESSSRNTSYQQYYQNNSYSDSNNYQQNSQSNGSGNSDDQDEEFQFFAGCTDWEQVKTRYRELMKIYHPDAGGHEEASKKINAEYNILKKRYGH